MASTAAVATARVKTRNSQTGDIIARLVVLMFAVSLLAITGLLVVELYIRAAPAREKLGWGFLTSVAWNPVTEEFGALPFLYGTAVTSLVGMLISVPLGVGAAMFLSELAPARISNALTFVIELLAAIPSVIYGLLAIFTLVPLMRTTVDPFLKSVFGFLPIFSGRAFGFGYLTAGVVLAIMTIPFVISVSREALLAVPREQREAALALGATRWETTWQIVVPYAKLGIVGAIFLGLARALGETMAVTMVIGNSPTVKASLLAPGYSIAAVIANEFAEAGGRIHPAALVELGLVLFGLTIVINGGARLMIIATTKKGSKR
ncbi:MAG TPA: phosphate ABC transporter permease subunit PstC [Bryobacteraceae bacterium]|nr:phosphate ABC transporter permease subunit PstC [Bryobacteraceae bacterium]